MLKTSARHIHTALLLVLGGLHLWTVNATAIAPGGVLAGAVDSVRTMNLLTIVGYAVPGSTAALASSFLAAPDQPDSIAMTGNLVFVGVLFGFAGLGWMVCRQLGRRLTPWFFASLFVLAGCNMALASHGWRSAAFETMAGWGAPPGGSHMTSTLIFMVSGLVLNMIFYTAWYFRGHRQRPVATVPFP